MSVNRSNFTLVFFKDDCLAYPGAEKNEQDQAHIFQNTFQKMLNTSASNDVSL